MKKSAYIQKNTEELRIWLKSKGLTPVEYPDELRVGLIAPYPNCKGEMVMYRSGLVFDDDNDADDYIFCDTEEEFKKEVLKLI